MSLSHNIFYQLENNLEIAPKLNKNIFYCRPIMAGEYKKPKKNKKRRKSIPKYLRHEVFVRDNYTCVECGARKGDIKPNGIITRLEIDHILPVSKGGTNDINNLQTLCWECNRNKSNNTW